jgi:hypothetical protein
MGNRRTLHAAVGIILLLLAAATSWAESSDGAVRRRPARERAGTGEGVYGLTMLQLHAGFSTPTGNLSEGFNSGWGAGVGIAHGVTPTILLSSSLAVHQFDAEGPNGDITIVPWTFDVDAVIPTEGKVRPWVGGGLGVYHEDVDVSAYSPVFGAVSASLSETNFGLNMGMGLGGPLGPRTLWGAGFKFHHIFEGDTFNDLSFFTFQFGFGYAL